MNGWHIDSRCVQEGWKPGNGEPRVVPIVQSTTFRYESAEALADIFIVSKVELAVGDALAVKVDNAAGTKCPRCWKHSLEANAEGLCPRCAKATSELNHFCEEVKELL